MHDFSFPQELIDQTIDHVFEHGDFEGLAACSLVHTTWTPTSQGRLFRRVTSLALGQSEKLAALIHQSPHIALYPKHLVLGITLSDLDAITTSSSSVTIFAVLFDKLSRLETLSFSLMCYSTDDLPRNSRFPQALYTKRLSYLFLGNWQFEDIVALTDMVAPSSTLKSLSLECCSTDPHAIDERQKPMQMFNLKHLELVHCCRSLTPALLKWVATGNIKLTTLSFSGLETDTIAELASTRYGLSAEGLELTYTSSERSYSHIPILERLVSSFPRVMLQCGFHSGVDHDPMLQDLELALLSISQPHDSTLQLVLHADGLHNDHLWSMVDEFIAKNEQLSIRDRFQSKGRGEQLKYVIDCRKI
ncbi:hypothetical protein B0H14DRAFT_3128531 [Mycena olivaceomarginata]|nr:hypothetical protein B0H14DRAFT_3128531 [Mycena olivaceomarginata]